MLVGSTTLHVDLVEVLRGLLNDDPQERWTIRDLELWLEGRRLTPKQVNLPRKSSRPIMVGGGTYENVRAVARALGKNWDSAAELVRGQDFDNWLRRSLSDAGGAETVNKITGGADRIQEPERGRRPSGGQCSPSALIPSAPIRHKGFSYHIDGIGPTLALNFNNDADRQIVAEFIKSRDGWSMDVGSDPLRAEYGDLFSKFDKLLKFLNFSGPGFGIERVLYELNEDIHCKSSIIEHFYVTDLDGIIPSLGVVSQGQNRPSLPMDRHIAAFLGARSTNFDDRLLRPLGNSADKRPAIDALNVMRLLATTQKLSRIGPMPGLCQWFVELMKLTVKSFHNLNTAAVVEASMVKASEQRSTQRDPENL